jgi:4-hydroxy-3-methylbut-2-enyl diphosphate reductase
MASVPAEHLLLLEPRGTCGGVDSAVQALTWLLLLDVPDLHCFHHIVHNDDVVGRFEGLGVTFVDDPASIPLGVTVVLSAHGTAPAVRAAIAERAGLVIDAICPLVAKVHREVGSRAAAGDRILYVGRAGHDESDAVLALAPASTTLVGSAADIDELPPSDHPVAVLAQTTLQVAELEAAEAAARRRFGTVWTPPRGDICDATTTRQAAVRLAAPQCDAVVVVGAATSSNTASLVAAALEAGAPRAVRVASAGEVPPDLAGTVAVTAGASTPARVVDAVIQRLGGRSVRVVRGPSERHEHFPVPALVRRLVEERVAAGTVAPEIADLAGRTDVTADDLLALAELRAGRDLTGEPMVVAV